jgi:hypothetical protein
VDRLGDPGLQPRHADHPDHLRHSGPLSPEHPASPDGRATNAAVALPASTVYPREVATATGDHIVAIRRNRASSMLVDIAAVMRHSREWQMGSDAFRAVTSATPPCGRYASPVTMTAIERVMSTGSAAAVASKRRRPVRKPQPGVLLRCAAADPATAREHRRACRALDAVVALVALVMLGLELAGHRGHVVLSSIETSLSPANAAPWRL